MAEAASTPIWLHKRLSSGFGALAQLAGRCSCRFARGDSCVSVRNNKELPLTMVNRMSHFAARSDALVCWPLSCSASSRLDGRNRSISARVDNRAGRKFFLGRRDHATAQAEKLMSSPPLNSGCTVTRTCWRKTEATQDNRYGNRLDFAERPLVFARSTGAVENSRRCQPAVPDQRCAQSDSLACFHDHNDGACGEGD